MDIDQIKTRLKQFGYEVSSFDLQIISHISKSVEKDVKGFCHVTIIPDELTEKVIDKICGEFLQLKRQTGTLECFDTEQLVETVKMGDTSVTIKGKSGADLVDALIKQLVSQLDERTMRCYRKVRW